MKLKVLQLNIWFGGKNREQLVNFIDIHSFDILIFQEVYKPHPDYIDPRYKLLTELQNSHGFTHVDFAPNFFMVSSIEDDVVNTDWGLQSFQNIQLLKILIHFISGNTL